MFSYKLAALANLVLALCASARPGGNRDATFDGSHHPAFGFHGTSRLPQTSCTGDYSYVTETYAPIVTQTETVMTTVVQAPSGQPTQLTARQDPSSPVSSVTPVVPTIISTATHTITDTTMLVHTATATATSIVSVTSTVIAGTETATNVMTVTSTITGTPSATTA
ncbi:hypothetical protein K466DRAFT_602076 [Polyporus arcularius HHB13444]|uniref:Uncharacterized protein n=1 Tax=Polyporus arcularius HHB13444 TaxID=1314778 RepID=A0A5C3P533_9APHY|nr:hypothetical protein K466DRAFT_602076 [Polyporus arcularius HHB13444]